MTDKLFDLVLAAIKKVPNVKVLETLQNGIPMSVDNGKVYYDEADQIIVGFYEKSVKRRIGFDISWLGFDIQRKGIPLASLEDVWRGIQFVDGIGSPVSQNEQFLIYENPVFDDHHYTNQGHFEVVAVGTRPFFSSVSSYSEETQIPGKLGISLWCPAVTEGDFLSQYFRDHERIFPRK